MNIHMTIQKQRFLLTQLSLLIDINHYTYTYQFKKRWCLDLNNVISFIAWDKRKCSINSLWGWKWKHR